MGMKPGMFSAGWIPGCFERKAKEMSEAIETTELYFYNQKNNSCIGIWDSASEPGWYWERYGLGEDGVWKEIDGGLWTVEYDDDDNIVEGYESVQEAYEPIAMEGDTPCEESLFEAVREVADAQFDWAYAKGNADEKLESVCEAQEEYLAELQEFLAAA